MIAAVVLAAGAARRFGGGKLVAPLAGRPLVDHVLGALADVPGVDRRLVVARPGDDRVAALARARGYAVVPCADADAGLSRSLRAGLRATGDADAVLVALGDGPALVPSVVARLLAARGDADAVRPAYGDGTPGHPVLLERPLLARVAELDGDRGFGPLLRGAAVRTVDCRDLPAPGDVDEPGDLRALEARLAGG